MSSIALDFSGLYAAAGIALLAALVATPGFWSLAAGLPAARRAVLAALAGQGVAGAASLLGMTLLDDHEVPPFALILTAILQAAVLPVLVARQR